jgi:hypothetical protein
LGGRFELPTLGFFIGSHWIWLTWADHALSHIRVDEVLGGDGGTD